MTGARKVEPKPTGTDWGRVDAFTDADIERMAEADPDNSATKAADWATATIGLPPPKTRSTPNSTWMSWPGRAQGRGYETRMNAALARKHKGWGEVRTGGVVDRHIAASETQMFPARATPPIDLDPVAKIREAPTVTDREAARPDLRSQ